MPIFTNIETWTERYDQAGLRAFTDQDGHLWVEQNPRKMSRWAKLVHQGHSIAWEFESSGGSYTGRLLFDGEITTPGEVMKQAGTALIGKPPR